MTNKRFKPEIGQEYYSITAEGLITSYYWEGFGNDNRLYSRGNCYPTHEAAKYADDRNLLIQEIRDFVAEISGDQSPFKVAIVYDETEGRLITKEGSITGLAKYYFRLDSRSDIGDALQKLNAKFSDRLYYLKETE
jgi:hypothetical protein